MARRTSRVSQWQGSQRDDSLTNLFGSICQAAHRKLGRDDISVGSHSEMTVVGLPLIWLCHRYLFQSTVFPLSRIMQIVGQEGSAKSAFLYEILRWHCMYGGLGALAENENKDSPTLRHSILQWNPLFLNRVWVPSTYSLEEWQDIWTHTLQNTKAMMDADGGPGRTIPFACSVDSVMASAPRDEINDVLKNGHSSRGYALAANLISRYMKIMPELIRNYPFTLIGTNHLKPSTDARGFPTANISGGKSLKFMETFEIEMSRAQNCDIDTLQYGGLRVIFKMKKNSIGPSRRQIQAELLWWHAPDEFSEGHRRQQTAWDWNTASIDLLLSFETAKGKKTIYNQLQEICDIRVVRKGTREAYSNRLSLGSSSEPVHFRDLGLALEARPDLMSQIHQVLGITAYREFTPGVDYRDAVNAARSESSQASRVMQEVTMIGDDATASDDESQLGDYAFSPEADADDGPADVSED